MLNKIYSLLFVASMACCFASASAAERMVLDTILVSVDGKPITLQDLRRRVSPKEVSDISDIQSNPELNYALDLLILEKLIEEEATKRRLSVSESEVKRYLSEIASRNNLSIEQFESALKREGKTLAAYKEQVKYDILRSKLNSVLMKSAPAVSDKEVAKYIESNPELFESGAKVKLKQIFISREGKSQEEIDERLNIVRDKLTAGDSFEELARKFSDGMEASSGGNLGVMALEDLSSQIAEILTDVPEGGFSKTIISDAGVQIFQVEQRFVEDDESALHNEVRKLLEREKNQSWLKDFYTRDIFSLHSVEKKV